MRSRKGLTLLEVIFSMVVLLVGLVAIVFLIPLAGREAEDSQQITQGLAAGESGFGDVHDNERCATYARESMVFGR